MTPEQDRKVEFVVSEAAEDAVRRGQDAYEFFDDPTGNSAGIAFLVVFLMAAACIGFLFGAAWRGSQIMGG